ncbi:MULTISPECIES: hypothetical protein [Haloarcula]|uniref:hypothetical protein n=1 Tax=Haloarcula TaxID=2237 RepID=UPI0023EB1B80|nr:hypothetical protein [Halomicroarcula sp. XH51]
MRPSLLYGALFSVPPAVALGIGATLLTGRVVFGAGAGLAVGALILTIVLLGTEVGEPDRAE